MKDLKNIILEKLRLDKNVKRSQYTCQPKDWHELRSILQERLKEDKDADLNDIDVSQITHMDGIFNGLDPYNIKIDKWDVSNVENMYYMFYNCKNFECIGLEKWDVSNVKDMERMFWGCIKFDNDLSNWDVSNVEDMDYMFYHCNSLKNLPDWYKK